MEAISSISRQAYRKPDEPLNIVSFCTHERYQSLVARTGHNFYLANTKEWIENYCPIPRNCQLLVEDMLPEVSVDLVWGLAATHAASARSLASHYHVPLCMLEVFAPNPKCTEEVVERSKHSIRGHSNVFLNEYSRDIWHWKDENCTIIEHGIDTEEFKPAGEKKLQILTVVNKWVERDWSHGYGLWKEVTRGLPVLPLGDTPGVSESVPLPDLIRTYQQSAIFLNTSLKVPVPTTIIEAMACGCAVCSTNTGGITEFLVHDQNALLASSSKELRENLEKLIKYPALRQRLGEAGRKTVIERFNIDRFVKEWDNMFRTTSNMIYRGECVV